MSRLFLVLLLGLTPPVFAGEKLRLAFSNEGTILSAQVGLVFEKTDILKKHGFAGARTNALSGSQDLKSALIAGQADVILTSETSFVLLLGNGFDCFALNSLGSAGRVALVVPTNSKIKTLDDLKGAKIATKFGTSIHHPVEEWIADVGLTDEIQILDMPDANAMRTALKAGTVQAMMIADPLLTRGLNQNEYRVLKQRDFDLVTVASPAFQKNKEAVLRLNAATKEALLYVAQNRAKVNAWFRQIVKLDMKTIDDASRSNPNYLAKSLSDVNLTISPDFRDHLNRQARFLFAQKSLTRLPELGKFLAQ